MSTRHTAGPWAFKEGDRDRRSMSDVFKAEDPEFRIAYVTCEFLNKQQRAEDIANARLIASAPAYALAWSMVPDEVQQRIFDALHKPDTSWVEGAIAQAAGGGK